MNELYKELKHPHDDFFHKIFGNPVNTRYFLEKVLPTALSSRIDYSTIRVEPTKYVSNQYKKGYSDIVVKVSIYIAGNTKKQVEIYFVIEHKTRGRKRIFLQVLKYMVLEWEKDYNNNNPPRLIIPVVFYNGKKQWKVPQSFLGQFDVDFEAEPELKKYLLDFQYILFDTNIWDYKDEKNRNLRENAYVFSALVLMKLAYSNDIESIREIFQYWDEKGFPDNNDLLGFFMRYICSTQDVKPDRLEKIIDESKINGGDIMPTLAERWKKEGKKEGKLEGKKEGIKEGEKIGKKEGIKEGKKEGKREVAYKLYEKGLSLDLIKETTGLSWNEVNKIAAPRPYSTKITLT